MAKSSFRIEGDGSSKTKIWDNDVLVEWNKCIIDISKDGSFAVVDKKQGILSRVVLLGVYGLIGDGEFNNTRLFIFDEMLRGVQSVAVVLEKGKDPVIDISSVFLPNLVEGKEND